MNRLENRTRFALAPVMVVASLTALLLASCAPLLSHFMSPTATPTAAPSPTATPVPPSAAGFWVASPNGMVSDTARNRLYVASRDTNSVIVWDEIGKKIANTIPVGAQPQGVELVNDRVFVANSNGASVTVIDSKTMTKLPDIDVSRCGSTPTNLAVNTNSNRVYVAFAGVSRIAVIDATNNTLVNCLTTDAGTSGIAINPLLNQLYAINHDAMTLQVFDISRAPERLIFTEDLGGVPYAMQANRSTAEVYVIVAFDSPNYTEANNLLVYSATNSDVSLSYATVVGYTENGGAIWISQATGALYIAETRVNQLEVLEPVDFSSVLTVSMPDPFGIAENVQLGRIYIGNRKAGWVNLQPNNYGGSQK